MQFLPTDNTTTTVQNTSYAPSAPSAPALIDSLRAGGPVNIVNKINNRHPIESRILNWESTQQQLKMETYKRLFGAADPIKREMDLEIIHKSEFRPLIKGLPLASSIHNDILLNKDTSIDWEDMYPSNIPSTNDIHSQMESHFKI
jgi:proteasome maturation protein